MSSTPVVIVVPHIAEHKRDDHRDSTARLVITPNITIQVMIRSLGMFKRFRFIRSNEGGFRPRLPCFRVTGSQMQVGSRMLLDGAQLRERIAREDFALINDVPPRPRPCL